MSVVTRLVAAAMERSSWKTGIRLPQLLEERREEFLSSRTGNQLRRLCEDFANSGEVTEKDDAILRVWLRLPTRYAIAQRSLVDNWRLEKEPEQILVSNS